MRDIAGIMAVAMSSVNGAVKRLADEGLVRHERYEFVELTPKGEALARKILSRHNLLHHLLRDILRIDPETAEKDACAIEHHLSQETLDRILDFFFFIESCPQARGSWNKVYEKCAQGACDNKDCELLKSRFQRRLPQSPSDRKMTLKSVPPGTSVRIKKICSTGALRKRLMDMGFAPGITVEVQREAPLGDPLEVKIRGFSVSLRKSEADSILVEFPVDKGRK